MQRSYVCLLRGKRQRLESISKAWHLLVQTIGNEFQIADIMEANENLFKDVLPQVGCQQFGDSFRPSELLHRLGGLVNNPTMRLSAQLASGSTQHVTSNAPQPPASNVFHSPSQPPPLPLSATNILRRRTSCSNYELMLQSILSHSCHHRADAVSAAKVLSISPRYGNIVKRRKGILGAATSA